MSLVYKTISQVQTVNETAFIKDILLTAMRDGTLGSLAVVVAVFYVARATYAWYTTRLSTSGEREARVISAMENSTHALNDTNKGQEAIVKEVEELRRDTRILYDILVSHKEEAHTFFTIQDKGNEYLKGRKN